MVDSEASYKVLIFGDQGVGKKTFLAKNAKKYYKSDTKMIIGVDFEVKHLQEKTYLGLRI